MAPFDVDDDGDLDFVFSIRGAARIVYYENLGEGNLSEQIVLAESYMTKDIEILDFNDDGLDDIVFYGETNGAIGWLPKIPGGFAPIEVLETHYSPGIDRAAYLDIDLDGDIDIVASCDTMIGGGNPPVYVPTTILKVFRRDSLGQFSMEPMIPGIQAMSNGYIDVIDFNDDGLDDLLYHNVSGLSVLLSDSELGLFSQIDSLLSPESSSISDADFVDILNDGHKDLIVRRFSQIDVLWREEASSAWSTNVDGDGFGVSDMALADVDGDFQMELFVGSSNTEMIYRIEFESLGDSISISISDAVDHAGSNGYVDFADMDGDSDMDMVSSSWSINDLKWWENENSLFTEKDKFSLNHSYLRAIIIADLNADGLEDIVTMGGGEEKSIHWFPQQDGGFPAQFLFREDLGNISCITKAEFNSDERDDLVFCRDGGIHALLSPDYQEAQVALVDGLESVQSILVSDLNNDDLDDIIIKSSEELFVTFALTSGSFGSVETVFVHNYWTSRVEYGDYNNDYLEDIVLINDSLYLFTQQVSGQFELENTLPLPTSGPWTVFSVDLNNDGYLDVAYYKYGQDYGYYRLGNGSASLGDEIILYEVITIADDPIFADFDADGDEDFIVHNYIDPFIQYYENWELDGFAPPIQINPPERLGDEVALVETINSSGMSVAFDAGHEVKILPNIYGQGCTDSAACNFDPNALYNIGNCCYTDCGCTVAGAENYVPDATCDNGECGFVVFGTVFYDENENGIMDEGEYGLPFEQVSQLPDSIALITNDAGHFISTASGSDYYTFSLAQNPVFPYFTTPETITFDAFEDNWNQHVYFGISDEIPDFEIFVNLYPEGWGYDCDVATIHSVCFRNMGNRIISGVVELTIDDIFQAYSEVTAIDSVIGQTIYMGFDSLYPGQMFFYDVELHTPTVDHIGEFLTSSARITGFHEGEDVAYGEKTLEMEITCAYDPNDKQTFPFGYTDAHYIQNDTTIEYLIRFQNTGNAPATDVVIKDILDEHLDLSSFQLVANSHSVITSVDPETREVVFDFSGIMLPDSVNNEPESHGLISFKIRPKQGLATGTEIKNRAAIFFDNNPPIITNLTWNTIFGCELMTYTGELAVDSICAGEEVHFQVDTELVEEISWRLDGEPVSDSTSVHLLMDAIGPHELILSLSNPICQKDSSLLIQVLPNPGEALISFVDGVLSVPDAPGNSYQWYMNGSPFITGQDHEWEPLVDGNYSVEIWNEYGCSSSSEVYVIALGLDELNSSSVSLFPNPMTEMAVIDLEGITGDLRLEVIDMEGRLLRSEQRKNHSGQLILKREALSSGNYLLRVISEKGQHELRFTVD